MGKEPLGPQWRVSSFTAGDQLRPTVEVDREGSFVVAWYSDNGTLRRRVCDHDTLTPGPESTLRWPAAPGSSDLEPGGGASLSWTA